MILSLKETGYTSKRTSFCQLYCISISGFSARALSGLSDVFHAPNQRFCAAEMCKGRVNFETELCIFLKVQLMVLGSVLALQTVSEPLFSSV